MTILNIETILAKLAKKRPVFHSEADFQHALAWEIKTEYSTANIRIEKPYPIEGKLFYIDLIVEIDSKVIAIELKYKTKKSILNLEFEGEKFDLKNHGAQNWGRYHFISDIVRLEKLMENYPITEGYAIFLTNDSYYEHKPKDTADYFDFSLENKQLSKGGLKWKDEKKINKELELKNSYTLNWKEYEPNHKFKYLIVKVEK